ncbi:helix-turn-helix transcriptional regulator [Bacillus sp. 31A1R]|uniref:Helix-turn-helix transcriptional regulator n=1 Tax=Robertmurraya mangrovi TaxID=3098077 RepID=A0ABU5IXV5_9BACI|nr:helix-turn-helix transcriptional regulator [Bacillus sp. 31A1R]MDZ5471993.1 helix-turn-helix transcriptional regulator [Bacillus sp. 31A1R]
MDKVLPRHNQIGEKIRNIRKKKKMTLEELAEGICSLGKMSNIENGRQPVKEDELQKISKKLEVPMSYFVDPEIGDKLTELDFAKQHIIELMALKEWSYTEKNIEMFKEKVQQYQIPSRLIDYYYLSGMLHLKLGQIVKAEQDFSHILLEDNHNPYTIRLKIKTYNAIASGYFSQKKLSRCLHFLNLGQDLSKDNPTITKEEKELLYYNFSIYHLYTGDYLNAFRFINQIQNHVIEKSEIDYIKLLVTILQDEHINDVKESLLSLRQSWQASKNQEFIIRGWAISTLLAVQSYGLQSDIAKNLRHEFLYYLENDNSPLKELKLSIIQLGIYLQLEQVDDKEYTEYLFKLAGDLYEGIEQRSIQARNLFLEGKYHLKFGKKQEASTFFELALSTLGQEDESFLKAEIYYHISKMNQANSIEMSALDIYYKNLKNQFLFTYFDDLILPIFKY